MQKLEVGRAVYLLCTSAELFTRFTRFYLRDFWLFQPLFDRAVCSNPLFRTNHITPSGPTHNTFRLSHLHVLLRVCVYLVCTCAEECRDFLFRIMVSSRTFDGRP
jgi:hypothetical protein